MRRMLVLLALIAFTVGCEDEVQPQVSQTLYLDPDGSFSWLVVQTDIRSGTQDPEIRHEEETAYVDAVRVGSDSITQALVLVDADWVVSRIVREERPYIAVTEARFGSIARMYEDFLNKLFLDCRAELVQEGSLHRLTFSALLEPEEWPEEWEQERPSAELEALWMLEPTRIVLTEGEFVSAKGFDIAPGGSVATLQDELDEEDQEEAGENGGRIALSLTWDVTGETGSTLGEADRTSHTLNLDPDGAVSWLVLQEEFRSGSERTRDAFRKLVLGGEHAAGHALRRLGASRVTSELVRAEPPFTVVTEARFQSIDEALEELLSELALEAEAELFLDPSETHLTFSFRERDPEQKVDEVFLALGVEPEKYRLLLTEGRFVSARGFDLDQGGTVATLQPLDEEERAEHDGRLIYSLSWTPAL